MRSRGLRTAVNLILYAAAKERDLLIPRFRKERAVLIPKDALPRVAHCGQPDSELVRGKGPQRGCGQLVGGGAMRSTNSPRRVPPVVDSAAVVVGGASGRVGSRDSGVGGGSTNQALMTPICELSLTI